MSDFYAVVLDDYLQGVQISDPAVIEVAQNVLPVSGASSGSNLIIFDTTFTDVDLSVAGVLVRTHGLNRHAVAVRILDSTNEQVVGASTVDSTLDKIAIDLAAFRPLVGLWRLLVL